MEENRMRENTTLQFLNKSETLYSLFSHRLIFKDVLPPEIIEYIVLHCPNLLTLGSLACTCKQFKNLVYNKVFNKNNISVKYGWDGADASFLIKGNGDLEQKIKHYSANYAQTRHSQSDHYKRKIQDRFKLDRLRTKLLYFINMDMTDPVKFGEIATKYQSKTISLHGAKDTKLSIDITVDKHRLNFKYSNNIKNNGNDDDEDPDLDWKIRYEQSILRLKCSMCAFKVQKFSQKICSAKKENAVATNSFSIKFVESKYVKWKIKCNAAGYASATRSRKAPKRVDERITTSILFKPSLIRELFTKIKKFHDSRRGITSNESDPDPIDQGGNNSAIIRQPVCYEFKCRAEDTDLLRKLLQILEPIKSELKININLNDKKI